MAKARGIVRAFGVAMSMVACARPSGSPPPEPRTPPAGERVAAVKCGAAGSVIELPTVALDPESRRELAAQLEAGVVAVHLRAEGCKLELERLPHCVGTPKYEYQPFWSAKANTEVVHDAQELALKLPLGAEKLGGMLAGDRVLRTDSLVVGVAAVADDAQVGFVGPDCERATHAVRKFHLGGFAMVRGASRLLEGGASVFRTGDASQTNEVERVAREGDPAECEQAAKQGKKMQQCAVPVRIRIVPLKRVVWDACPEGAQSDGTQCVPKAPPAASGQPSATTPGRMARIPAGTCRVGSSDRLLNEEPVRTVTLQSFAMDVTEVTVAEYESCVRAAKCSQAPTVRTCNAGKAEREQHPINCIEFTDAKAYCKWAGKRLPTEEEWEYAARGAEGRVYPWGKAPPRKQLCWNGEGNEVGKGNRTSTCPVGTYPSGGGPFGLHDMAGNVAEFAVSGSGKGGVGVIRGGGWTEFVNQYVDPARRRSDSGRSESVGFRCARSP
jgi:formylglycine-generating enzyme required for sulfatase activity